MAGLPAGVALTCVAAVLFIAAPAVAQSGGFRTERCPVPADVAGYPVWIEFTGAGADSARAAAVADAVARRWVTPSPGRARHPGVDRTRRRVMPPEPRWADDWSPGAEHLARVAFTLHPDGRAAEHEVLVPSGDRLFDRSLPSVFRDEPWKPDFPAGGDGPVRVVAHFGHAPAPDAAGVVRFAAQQQPVRVVPGTLRVYPPDPRTARGTGEPSALVKYDVDAAGQLVPGSVEVLRSSDPRFGRAVAAGLAQARFTAAESNCRPVALSVVQRFGR